MDMAISRIQPTKNENGEGGFANGSNVAEVEGDVDDSGAAAEEDGSSLPRLEPSSEKESSIKDGVAVVSVVISQNEARNQVLDLKTSHGNVADFCKDEKVEVLVGDAGHKRVCLQRTESYHEQCRVCHQQTEELLLDLGCQCRGELAKVHRSCIDIWFHTKGSNKCEICQQVAVNIPSPVSQTSSRYWIWRVDPAHGGLDTARGERGRGCCNPLWIALIVLVGGLLLDVLISIALGVSALPVNIIIGVLILLGLATVLRLTLEFCNGWNSSAVLISFRRVIRGTDARMDANINSGYHTTV